MQEAKTQTFSRLDSVCALIVPDLHSGAQNSLAMKAASGDSLSMLILPSGLMYTVSGVTTTLGMSVSSTLPRKHSMHMVTEL